MPEPLSISLVQENFLVGAVRKNTDKVIQIIEASTQSDIVLFPELTLTGYPPEDLLLRDDVYMRLDDALSRVQAASMHSVIVIGHPWREKENIFNAASVYYQGLLLARAYKQKLPNYSVFDEVRYFTPGESGTTFDYQGRRIGLLICEDLWHTSPIQGLKAQGAELVLSLNASPYNQQKLSQRIDVIRSRVTETGLPLVYVNHVCGQDELVFDGGSFAMDATGEVNVQLPLFDEMTTCIIWELGFQGLNQDLSQSSEVSEIYQALVLAVRDYVNKNGFRGAVMGLSGGIDSALTLAIAVDALGADRVQALMMPFLYTSQMSVEDAKKQAEVMNIEFEITPIEPMFNAYMETLAPLFGDTKKDTTEENLQARLRGVLLMALSNKKHRILLTTGNKSELAVGYCTLYGDMCGGFAVIKDVPKMMVYQLAEYRNSISPVIPQRVIDRPASAELAPDQIDEDSLPPYDVLDYILQCYVEEDKSIDDIVEEGFSRDDVQHVVNLVDLNEYKRRQAAVGPKITSRNFGKDRRYPITSGFRKEN
ncbi:NAD+ synthase [Algicola sagamiensis]|uniref:NAD+ synthase n=1 Tax=Algicola sagamiensis TaxID=163869 RepID=UPI0004776D6D